MKVNGFIGPAYSLDSVNVDHQRCVNLYPEKIESGTGKGGSVAYLKTTPGLIEAVKVGDGPIRCIHTDLIGRNFVVSGNKVYTVKKSTSWTILPTRYEEIDDINTGSDVDATGNEITASSHGYYTGLKVQISSSASLPTGLSASTDYWVIVGDDDTIKLATSLADAIAGNEIDFSDTGTGTITITPQIPFARNFDLEDINDTEDSITIEGHGFYTGLMVRFPTVSAESGGIEQNVDYFIIKEDDDTIFLATSISNASDNTTADIEEASGEWTKTLIGANGESGGDEITFTTSSGIVKARSMSQLGEGLDSSTVFVDGSNNYLFEQKADSSEFSILGSLSVQEAVFDDVTIYTTENLATFSGGTIRLQTSENSSDNPSFDIKFTVGYTTGLNDFRFSIYSTEPVSVSEFNEFFSNGSILGKTVLFQNLTNLEDNVFSFRAVDDGSGDTIPFSIDTTKSFSSNTYSGGDYGSVPTATDVVWIDGYFIVNKGGTNKFFVSDLLGFEIDTLDFASSEGKHDVIVALMDRERELWVFNELSTEVFFNTGNEIFPFERVGGGYIEIGCLAKRSVAKIDSTVFWLGQTESGKGIVYAASSSRPQRISTHAIEQAIRSYQDPSGAVAWTYEEAGHKFYVLNFQEATWVYDLSTGLWHERAYTNSGDLERHRVNTHSYDFKRGLHLCGDYETNQIYLLDEDTFKDGTTEITRLRTSPHLSESDSLKRIICDRFQLDMETGVGLSSGQGSDPQVMLQWSDDGGHTWSSESWTSAGGQVGGVGEYKKRVSWRRLGAFRDRIWRVQITDPVKVNIIAAHMDVRVLGS